MALAEACPLERFEIIQIVPDHRWGGALAVVNEIKSWGVQAYVMIPKNDGTGGEAYIRLADHEFERVGAKVIYARQDPFEWIEASGQGEDRQGG